MGRAAKKSARKVAAKRGRPSTKKAATKKRGRPATKKIATKKRGRPAGKKSAVKKTARKAVRKSATKKTTRKVRRNPLKSALKAHSAALQTVNAIQKKLDKAKEAQKKAFARIEAIKAKEVANEAKAVTKVEKLAAAKAKKAAEKEAKTVAKKSKREKNPVVENITEEAAFEITQQVEDLPF
jgi:hypothetical protein